MKERAMTVPVLGSGSGPMLGSVWGGGQIQPWNGVVFPSAGSNWPIGHGMSPTKAKSIPAVSRAVQLLAGMLAQMPMDRYKGKDPLGRPRLLDQPDPERSRSWFVSNSVEDWLLNGNAIHYVTTRDAEGWPATVVWVPADWVTVTVEPGTDEVRYWVSGRELDSSRVVHVRRGADRAFPVRGVGVVEQHLQVLGRADAQERYEASLLTQAAVPSVAVIAPNPQLSQEEADTARVKFMEKYGGSERTPGVFPAGTQILPLSWSPHDQELAEAKRLSLLDVANIFNLDGYWVGAPSGSSLTYRSPGPLYLNLLRQTLGPIIEEFELTWSASWLPRGSLVKFDRKAILGDDMTTTIAFLDKAVRGRIMTLSEAREYMGLDPEIPDELREPAAPAPNDPSPLAEEGSSS